MTVDLALGQARRLTGVEAYDTPLADDIAAALERGCANEAALYALADLTATSRRDRVLGLLAIYDLHGLPVHELGPAARFAHHPAIVELKGRLEAAWMAELDARVAPEGDAVAAMRALAARDRIPELYRWVAETAEWPEVVDFLALEGGPDGGFDDLVAICQLGLHGRAKLELASNFWDEMGRGDLAGIHTILHEQMAAAIDMPPVAREDQPTEALERTALGSLFATNRWLQPEMLGALGLIELQAGPRCRMVVRAFDRLGAPAAAYPFYVVHAQVDPLHGRTWLENAIIPVVAEQPDWAERIVRGAWWRSQVNAAFFDGWWAQLAVRGAVGGGIV